jgi:hypothetical protein
VAGVNESEAPAGNEERGPAADGREGVHAPRLLTSPQATLVAYILRWIVVGVVAAALIVLLLGLL